MLSPSFMLRLRVFIGGSILVVGVSGLQSICFGQNGIRMEYIRPPCWDSEETHAWIFRVIRALGMTLDEAWNGGKGNQFWRTRYVY